MVPRLSNVFLKIVGILIHWFLQRGDWWLELFFLFRDFEVRNGDGSGLDLGIEVLIYWFTHKFISFVKFLIYALLRGWPLALTLLHLGKGIEFIHLIWFFLYNFLFRRGLLNLYRRGCDFIFINLVYFLEFRFNLRFYWLLKRINVIYLTYHTKWESFNYWKRHIIPTNCLFIQIL